MPESDEKPEHERSAHSPAMLLLSLLASTACLLLGWWQWNRFHESGGSFQNLGYALQWPLFAVFFVYGYLRFFGLLRESQSGRDMSAAPHESAAMPPLPEPARSDQLDGAQYRGRVAYNAMLAELAEQAKPVERNSR
ncbi:MAG: acetolactate synthase [Segniliparus sp.]|uniref:acetolactate synthase n=1 Tax=Segniliparus sp. TaxID=2804064 RepID=UPI003F35CB27